MSFVTVLLIDPQNDFCDFPEQTVTIQNQVQLLKSSLPVFGADADMRRAAHWLLKNSSAIDDIVITLDSHQRFNIAHPDFWLTKQGEFVAPFTAIHSEDVRTGVYQVSNTAFAKYAIEYLQALERQGRYTHMVWPVHCEIGTWGHGVHAILQQAIQEWQKQKLQAPYYVHKGTNPLTEHYSAVQAEVPIDTDPATCRNLAFLDRLARADKVVIAGEASSHCVRSTVEDILQNMPTDFAQRLVLLTDCTSPVTGFQKQHDEFLQLLQESGVQLKQAGQFCLDDATTYKEMGL